jgi:hypothetical protein
MLPKRGRMEPSKWCGRAVAPERSAPAGCARVNTLSTKVYYRSLTQSPTADIRKQLKLNVICGLTKLFCWQKQEVCVPKLDGVSPRRHEFSTAQSVDFVALS